MIQAIQTVYQLPTSLRHHDLIIETLVCTTQVLEYTLNVPSTTFSIPASGASSLSIDYKSISDTLCIALYSASAQDKAH